MHTCITLSQSIQKLMERGYITDFNMTIDKIKCSQIK